MYMCMYNVYVYMYISIYIHIYIYMALFACQLMSSNVQDLKLLGILTISIIDWALYLWGLTIRVERTPWNPQIVPTLRFETPEKRMKGWTPGISEEFLIPTILSKKNHIFWVPSSPPPPHIPSCANDVSGKSLPVPLWLSSFDLQSKPGC